MQLFAPAFVAALLFTSPALAASTEPAVPLALGLPFVGLLASIAIGPLVAFHFWHHHYGKVAAFWAALALAGLAASAGLRDTAELLFHTLALEYLPFILMLLALFTCAGGLVVRGDVVGGPRTNVAILALGTMLASLVGTTGAAMILIRPLLRANAHRRVNAHVVVFFIFLVGNIGGALSPLGDPPLFLGFLRGVDFFWPLRTLWPETLGVSVALLSIFAALDAFLARRDKPEPMGEAGDVSRLSIGGAINLPLIALAVGAIVTSGVWRPGVAFEILGTPIETQNLVREAVLLAVALASIWLTPDDARADNAFDWEPIQEVAKIFAALFVCLVPVMSMLHAGTHGPFAPLIALVQHQDGRPIDGAYFWMTGLISSVLDNAPTYLVFFQLAGGDAHALMGPLASTLAAISLGAVFMGAGTYIGNAPNFMVYAIARRAGVRMPGFFGYMAWSGGILVPLFLVLTFFAFRI